jgi:hypothetical protein
MNSISLVPKITNTIISHALKNKFKNMKFNLNFFITISKVLAVID